MKKMILTGFLVTLFNSAYAMETDLDTSIERQNEHPSTRMQTVEPRDIGPLPLSQINVDSLRTIIQDAVTFAMTMRDRLSPDAMIDVVTEISAREVTARVGILAIQAQAIIDQIKDAYRHELADLEAQRAEIDRQRLQAEKINTLRGILLHILVTDKSPITLRAANIIELDILERHQKVEELYKRFLPYSELFGRTDLDVVATSDDLDAVRHYIDETSEAAILGHFGIFNFVTNSDFNGKSMGAPLYAAKKRLEDQIAHLSREGVETLRARTKLAQIFQLYQEADDIVSMSRNDAPFWGHQACEISYYKNGIALGHAHQEFGGGWWGGATGIFGNVPAGKGRGVPVYEHWSNAVSRRSRELTTTVEAIKSRARELFVFETEPASELNRAYRLAHSIPPRLITFPSESFNRLVDQVNRFFTEGLQDAH